MQQAHELQLSARRIIDLVYEEDYLNHLPTVFSRFPKNREMDKSAGVNLRAKMN